MHCLSENIMTNLPYKICRYIVIQLLAIGRLGSYVKEYVLLLGILTFIVRHDQLSE